MGIARAKASAALDKVSAAVIARRWLIAGVVVDLATLAYFKYANFGVGSFNEMLQSMGMQPFAFAHVILPIGISFYTFESIRFITDVYCEVMSEAGRVREEGCSKSEIRWAAYC